MNELERLKTLLEVLEGTPGHPGLRDRLSSLEAFVNMDPTPSIMERLTRLESGLGRERAARLAEDKAKAHEASKPNPGTPEWDYCMALDRQVTEMWDRLNKLEEMAKHPLLMVPPSCGTVDSVPLAPILARLAAAERDIRHHSALMEHLSDRRIEHNRQQVSDLEAIRNRVAALEDQLDD